MSLHLCVVIPIAAGDLAWRELLPLLACRHEVHSIWLSTASSASAAEKQLYRRALEEWAQVKWIEGPAGRGQQINRGVEQADEGWVWILHADSRWQEGLWAALVASCARWPERLHYFDLDFEGADLRLQLNRFGVRWRSQLFGMPFGDQGFILQKARWRQLGGFPTGAAYGEDHLFVWKWRQAGWRLQRIAFPLLTSARKYTAKGWWPTTRDHVKLTWIQAWPEILKLYGLRRNPRPPAAGVTPEVRPHPDYKS